MSSSPTGKGCNGGATRARESGKLISVNSRPGINSVFIQEIINDDSLGKIAAISIAQKTCIRTLIKENSENQEHQDRF